jgi:nitrogen regulatory protein PII
MQHVKRIEIITDALVMGEVIRVLEREGVSGYTVVPNVTGKGERGAQSGDDLTDVFKNSMLITACDVERVASLVEAIRPMLARRGGVCLVSDAQWVIH